MSGSYCVYKNCKNSSIKCRVSGVYAKFFRMPKDEAMITKNRYHSWLEALGIDPEERKVSHSNQICSVHFNKDDINITPRRKMTLRHGAIPKVHLGPNVERRKYLLAQRKAGLTVCRKWIQSIGRQDLLDKSGSIVLPKFRNYRVCSDHFDDEMYMNPNQKSGLFPLAEPIQFKEAMDFSENMQYLEAVTSLTKESTTLMDVKEEPVNTYVSPDDVATSSEYIDMIKVEEHPLIVKSEPQSPSSPNASPQQPVHKCKICQFETTDETYFPVHMKTHNKQRYSCDSCSYFCGSPIKLKNHQKKFHMDLEDLLYYCGDCSFTTLQKRKLGTHRRIEHRRIPTGKERHGCPKCPYRSPKKLALIRHQIKTHQDPFFQCIHCQKPFLDEEEYNTHCLSHLYSFEVTRDGKFKCRLCNFFTKDQTLMSEHNKSAHGEG